VQVRVAALQGWLPVLVPGEPVTVRPLASLADELRDALRGMAALVASHEDLAAMAGDASRAITALRNWAGPYPVLAVTAGEAGVLLDLPGGGRTSVPAPVVVTGVPTVGAGDALAALFAAALGLGTDPVVAAGSAAAGVSRWLALRAAAPPS
jgi:sugar/nucleoside kinase (ribokinase family)